MTTAHLYIVEDEPDLAALIADYAGAAGYAVTVFGNGENALDAMRIYAPDLLVLDLMLPGMDGLAVCRAVRTFSDLPIVMVTARVEEIDRLLGLESGADDYVCKPFSPRELIARIRVVLRRTQPAARVPQTAYYVDSAARQIVAHGALLELTPTEYRLFAALIQRPGQIFSRAQLLDIAQPEGLETTDRSVDSHVKNLRRKLARAAPNCDPIQSVYGLGYRFEP